MVGKLKTIARSLNYHIYERPFEMNIWGLRSNNVVANRMDDEFHVFFNTNTNPSARPKWAYYVYSCTTDPGTYWLTHPINPQGTAILAPGQYQGAYGIALHQGKYKALCQIHKPVTVIRDYDRNAYLDFLNGTSDTGMHGINIHRAKAQGSTKTIDKHSAGCQVFANATEFELFMQQCDTHRQFYGNTFTYTLVDFRMARRTTYRRIAYGSALIGLGALSWWGSKELIKSQYS